MFVNEWCGHHKAFLQNEMAAVRCILKQAGRDRLAQSERLNNRSLGLSGASRNGTKLAITPEHYRDVLETARAKIRDWRQRWNSQRLMGLRSQEAVQSAQSLRTWRQSLERVSPFNRGVRHQRRASAKPLFWMLSLSEKRWIMRWLWQTIATAG